MRSVRWNFPNLLTLLRLILVPVLWVLALVGLPKAVGCGLIVAALTDVFDGRLARRYGLTSAFGSKLDAIADTCISFSAVGWLLVLHPSVVQDHPFFFASMTVAAIFALWREWVKFGRLADFHLNSGRAAGILGYILLIDLFLFDQYVQPLFYTLMVVAWIVVVEALMLVFTRDDLDERVSSPLLAYVTGSGRSDRNDGRAT